MSTDAPDPAPPDAPPAGSVWGPDAPRWARILGTLGGMFLGGVLVVALWGKTLDPQSFIDLVAHEELDFLLPAAWVASIGLALEAILGFALLFNLRHLRVLVPSAALVAFFVFLVSRTYYRHVTGEHVDTGSCGCFGNIVDRSPEEAFWWDLILLVPGITLAFLGRPADPMPYQRVRWGVTWALTILVLFFAWLAPNLPIDDIATRLHPGAVAAELCAGRDEDKVCLNDVIFEIDEGKHVVVIADITDEAFLSQLDRFNAYALDGVGPSLWVLTSAGDDAISVFTMTHQPTFTIVPTPVGVVRPLYRRLPRSFVAQDGTVTRTIEGWPPLAELAAGTDAPDDEPDGDGDANPDPQDDEPGDGG